MIYPTAENLIGKKSAFGFSPTHTVTVTHTCIAHEKGRKGVFNFFAPLSDLARANHLGVGDAVPGPSPFQSRPHVQRWGMLAGRLAQGRECNPLFSVAPCWCFRLSFLNFLPFFFSSLGFVSCASTPLPSRPKQHLHHGQRDKVTPPLLCHNSTQGFCIIFFDSCAL